MGSQKERQMKARINSFSSDRDVWVVDGYRSPFVKAGAEFKDLKAVSLGVPLLKELLYRTGIPLAEIDEVVLGNTGCPEDAANISRVISLEAGIPQNIPAYTVHRNCASAMESIAQGFMKIQSGFADVIIVGGVESMSNMPLIYSKPMTDLFASLMRAKTVSQRIAAMATFRPHFLKPIVAIQEGLTDAVCGLNMGQTAELIAREAGITRSNQDRFALQSHERALAAMAAGRLEAEIVPIATGRNQDVFVKEDVGPRKGQSIEALAKLKPYFDKKNGTVTVGNACPITDGACFLLLMSAKKAKELGYDKPLGKIRSAAFAALEPQRMGLGPVYSTPVALDQAGLTMKQIGLVEINEAFAAQVLAVLRAFDSKAFAQEKLGRSDALGAIDESILNVNGGAIALGHPVGATGSRLVLTALKEMQRRSNVEFSLASLCIGGGQGGSVVLQKVS